MVPGTPESMVQETCVLPYGEDESLEFIEAHARRARGGARRAGAEPPSGACSRSEFLRELREVTARTGDRADLRRDDHRLPHRARRRAGVVRRRRPTSPPTARSSAAACRSASSPARPLHGRHRRRHVAVRRRVVPGAENTFFAGTFNHHPLAMAAALRRAPAARARGAGAAGAAQHRTTAELAERLNDAFAARRRADQGRALRLAVPLHVERPLGSVLLPPARARHLRLGGAQLLPLDGAQRRRPRFPRARRRRQRGGHDRAAGCGTRAVTPAGRVGRGETPHTFPLTTAQHRMYAMCQSPGAELAYHVPLAMVVEGPLNEGARPRGRRQLGRTARSAEDQLRARRRRARAGRRIPRSASRSSACSSAPAAPAATMRSTTSSLGSSGRSTWDRRRSSGWGLARWPTAAIC